MFDNTKDYEAVIGFKGIQDQFGWPKSYSQTMRDVRNGLFPNIVNKKKHRNTTALWRRREVAHHIKHLN